MISIPSSTPNRQPHTLDFEPHRFRSTVDHYVRGRLPYPRTLIRRVINATRLAAGSRVLDLGCGPGFLAFAFEPYVREVIGVDPEPAMLQAATEHARALSLEIDFLQGSSYDLPAGLGLFHLIVMGRSFHWMNRAATLRNLADHVSPKGAIVLFGDSHPAHFQINQWKQAYQSVLDSYGRTDKVHGSFGRNNPAWVPDEILLHESEFNRIERVSILQQLSMPISRLTDRALSMSSTSPEKLGSRLPDFLEELEATLQPFARNGRITELVEFEALIGFKEPHPQRPQDRSDTEDHPYPLDPAAMI
ncbi:MAG: hypothetical protein B9S32_01135 [Verrucomicrobia bacterium Tous-C9LFEB]|nr:MAG: hypothetical protein B9S32_01135 [Verrucomicrobia bacterium Tous-C9LFEB]